MKYYSLTSKNKEFIELRLIPLKKEPFTCISTFDEALLFAEEKLEIFDKKVTHELWDGTSCGKKYRNEYLGRSCDFNS